MSTQATTLSAATAAVEAKPVAVADGGLSDAVGITDSTLQSWLVSVVATDTTSTTTVQLSRSNDQAANVVSTIAPSMVGATVDSALPVSNADYFTVSSNDVRRLVSSVGGIQPQQQIIVPAAQVFKPTGAIVSSSHRRAPPAASRSVVQQQNVGRGSAAGKRGRRPQQMMSVLRPDILNRTVQQTVAVAPEMNDKSVLATLLQHQQQQQQQQQQLAGAGVFDVASVSAGYAVAQQTIPVAYTGGGHMAAASASSSPAPGIIHIDENAKVMQTDDGMIIVCNPDGTIQIHGHTEGQAIPLDAVKALLGIDEMQHTLVTVNDGSAAGGGQMVSSSAAVIGAGQQTAMLNLDVGQALMPVDATSQALFGVGGQSLMTIDGTQTLVSVDGTQSFLAVDGSGQTLLTVDGQTLVGIDPSQAATLVTLDGGQTFMTLDVGQTLVTMDCAQGAAMVGIDGQEMMGIEPGQSML
jgi:hypothetical protein